MPDLRFMQPANRTRILASCFPSSILLCLQVQLSKRGTVPGHNPISASPSLRYHGKSISGPHLPRANVSQVDKIHWFPNHGPVNPSPLLLLLGEDRELHHSGGREESLENHSGKS